MKLLLENWRKYLEEAEEQEPLLGVSVDWRGQGYGAELALIDLTYVKNQLQNSQNIDEFFKKISSKEIREEAVVGYIETTSIPLLAKGQGLSYVGGQCFDTHMVVRAMGPGMGEKLYNALLGFAAVKGIYVTSDRKSVSPGAEKRWSKIDQQTSDEVPPNSEPYKGQFDDRDNQTTKPKDDNCQIHGIDHLDKGYQDHNQVDFFEELEYNLNTFFENEIEPLFDEPGFFGKLFGNTPQNKAEKIKDKLINFGRRKFIDWEIAGKPWNK
tara:strand:+ start:145 stop:948 length:804 start_codon:yes stop_codon:yes gene_type:complete